MTLVPQAWFETDADGSHTAAFATDTEDGTEDWLATDSTRTPGANGSAHGRAVSFALPRRSAAPELLPVAEESQHGAESPRTGNSAEPAESADSQGNGSAAPAAEAAAGEAADAAGASDGTAGSAGGLVSRAASSATSTTATTDSGSSRDVGFWQRRGGSSAAAAGSLSEVTAATSAEFSSGDFSAGDSTLGGAGAGALPVGGGRLAYEDASQQSSTEAGSSAPGGSSRRPAPKPARQLLFIQMEFCPRTLRQVRSLPVDHRRARVFVTQGSK